MELYVLDGLLRRTAVVDRYESLIWTERYTATGDFELVITSTDANKQLLSPGKRLALNQSNRVMTVEEIEDKDDSEGRSLLTIKGPSLENILNTRATRGAGGTTGGDTSKWTLSETPTSAARHIFNSICVTNTAIPADVIPYYYTPSPYTAGTIPEPSGVITFDVPTDSVYNVIKDLADSYGFGFRLTRGPDNSRLYFDVYMGSNRTTAQNDLGAVIFSRSLGTLDEVSELTSLTDFYNVAYVYHPSGSVVVAALGYETVSGLDRRVLVVDGSDITGTGTALTTALTRRGNEELAKHDPLLAIDGQAPQMSIYKYGVDYNLGDLVELRAANGDTQNMRVTEQIFVQDDQGERSYPTLVADVFITPGSWSAWDSNEQWADVPTTTTWANIT